MDQWKVQLADWDSTTDWMRYWIRVGMRSARDEEGEGLFVHSQAVVCVVVLGKRLRVEEDQKGTFVALSESVPPEPPSALTFCRQGGNNPEKCKSKEEITFCFSPSSSCFLEGVLSSVAN